MEQNHELRRQRRRENAEKRAQQKKRLLIRLGIAAGILLVVVILLVILISNNNKPPARGGKNTTTYHMVFGGDITITNQVVASGGADYDYTQTFMDVAHIFAGADLSAVNFEGLLYGEPYGTDGEGSAPSQILAALNSAGVDLVRMANSYTLNHGNSGLSMTLSGIRSAGMEPVGAYSTSQEAQEQEGYTLCNVGGMKIAIVAFTKGMNGNRILKQFAGCVNVLYTDYDDNYQTVDTEGIKKVLAAAEKAEPDLTIAMLHWGSEYSDPISESQKEILQLMQDNGVDAVIGTHARRVQEMVYDESTGTFVAYCLGEMLGDAERDGAEYSVLLDLQITKNNDTGAIWISGYDYVPIYVVREEGKPLRVVRIKEAMQAYEKGYIDAVSQETYNSMKNALERIEARVNGE